ncbi:uncharacterized protein SETTUDRAFT_19958 [Exserohilum turcica Et28A]|uniref:Endonuclease/exonuclease/phosphatase domain-containing protein n=1 Tax=Exserohilum turcicum (strain 28A) TaxID=671987 RepID=R0IRX1_EXST2|nr:uncharacterized protein SETTUDRAFT_19958 [Exserohilum turcica Et28A]EOA87441.1 hypothetical protein SETTUDRAFT_19958 [Exserohilum turcica Et28A]
MAKENYQCHNDLVDNMEEIIQLTLGQLTLGKHDGTATAKSNPLLTYTPSDEMPIQEVHNEDLHILSASLKGSEKRWQRLYCCIKSMARTPDRLAKQEALRDRKEKELAKEEALRIREQQKHDTQEASSDSEQENDATNSGNSETKKLAKVAFLVKRGVQYDDLEAEEANRGLVWSLRIPTRDGVVAIHNFYNHPDRKLDIEKLMDLCIDEEEAHVLLGDSNLHHPRWGGESLTKTDADGTRLVNLIDLLHMKCMNIPGVKTYARGSHTSGKYTSTLDIAVVSQNIEDRSHYELLMDVFSSDHQPDRRKYLPPFISHSPEVGSEFGPD